MLGSEEEISEKVRIYISEDRLDRAIEILKAGNNGTDELSMQEANLNEIERQNRNSMIDFDTYKRHKSKIRNALLEISRKINQGNYSKETSTRNLEGNQETELRLKIVMSSLEIIVSRCDIFIPNLKARLKRLNTIQLISQLVIAFSGASLLIKMSTELSMSFNYLIGGLTLIGSLLTIFIQGKSTSINPNSKSLFNIYEDLVNLHLNAEQKLSEFNIHKSLPNGLSNKKLSVLIESSNDLCLEVRKLMLII